MAKIKVWHFVSVAALASSMAVYAADSLQGTISKVENDGMAITVKGTDGKETKLKISKKRTELDGVKDSGELKVGQSVTIMHEDGEAKKLSAAKAK